MKPIEIKSLIGKPLKGPSGQDIGIITSAHVDTTGIRVSARVTDESLRRIIRKESGATVGGYT